MNTPPLRVAAFKTTRRQTERPRVVNPLSGT